MRLGDLDKLESGLRIVAKHQSGERQQGILGCCETIRLAPTVDAVPVRRGKWIPKNADGSWRVDTCSSCKRDTHYVRFAPRYDYCPNCGAKME